MEGPANAVAEFEPFASLEECLSLLSAEDEQTVIIGALPPAARARARVCVHPGEC